MVLPAWKNPKHFGREHGPQKRDRNGRVLTSNGLLLFSMELIPEMELMPEQELNPELELITDKLSVSARRSSSCTLMVSSSSSSPSKSSSSSPDSGSTLSVLLAAASLPLLELRELIADKLSVSVEPLSLKL